MTTWCLYFFRSFTRWYVPKIEICLKYYLDTKFPKASIVETTYYSWSFILIVHRLHGRLVVLSLGRSCSLCNAFKSHSSCGISGKVAIYSCYVLYKQTGTFVNNFWLYIGISFSVKKPILKGFTLNYPRHYHALW